MYSETLFNALSNAISKTKVEEFSKLAQSNTGLVEQFLALSFHHKHEVAFRAAWILENIYLANPQNFTQHVNWFLTNFPNQNNSSARRNFAKILALITKKNAPKEIKEIVSNFDTDQLVETVFAWLIDEQVAVAIKSHCLSILANLSAKHRWIKEELRQTMDFLLDKESIAFYAKVKQIRKQLK